MPGGGQHPTEHHHRLPGQEQAHERRRLARAASSPTTGSASSPLNPSTAPTVTDDELVLTRPESPLTVEISENMIRAARTTAKSDTASRRQATPRSATPHDRRRGARRGRDAGIRAGLVVPKSSQASPLPRLDHEPTVTVESPEWGDRVPARRILREQRHHLIVGRPPSRPAAHATTSCIRVESTPPGGSPRRERSAIPIVAEFGMVDSETHGCRAGTQPAWYLNLRRVEGAQRTTSSAAPCSDHARPVLVLITVTSRGSPRSWSNAESRGV